MALVELVLERPVDPVDLASADHRVAGPDLPVPAHDVFVFLHGEELGRVIELPGGQHAVPRPDRHVGDGVGIARHVGLLRQPLVEHVELALHLHREPVDGVFHLVGRVGVEVAETAAEIGRRAHLPEQPRQAFRAFRRVLGQEGAVLLREIEQDRAGLEDAGGFGQGMVDQRRNLRVGIDRDEPGAELVALADVDDIRVVFRAGVPRRQQLLQHHGDLHAVGRRQRVKLKRVLAARQLLLVRRARDGTVDGGEPAAVLALPFPDPGRFVGGGFGHRIILRRWVLVPSAGLLPHGSAGVNLRPVDIFALPAVPFIIALAGYRGNGARP